MSQELVLRCLNAWSDRDLPGVVACLAPHVRYTLHAEEGPLAGTAEGREVVAERLAAFMDLFDFLAYVVDGIRSDGPIVRTSIVFWYRHRKSRLELNGRYRHVWRVEDGLIVACDEFHDAAKLNAFMRLASQE